MKQLVLLASVLTLTACGGGGGGSGSSADRTRPFDSERIVSNATYNSNQNVTSMASRLLVAKNGSGHTIARSASTTFDGVEYDEYDLSDVNFNLSDEGFGGIVRFGVNSNKKIINFSLIDDDTGFVIDDNKVYTQTENGEVYLDGGILKTHNDGVSDPVYNSETGLYTYESNNEGQSGTFKIIDGEIFEPYDGDEFDYDSNNKLISNEPSLKIINGKVYSYETFDRTDDESFSFNGQVTTEGDEQVDAVLKYVSSGKDVKLRYSDFGYFELITENENENRPVSIIGGYDIKRIANNNLPSTDNDIVFTGAASGSVVALRGGDVHTIELKDTNAELKFNNGTSTLNATFDNWYDVGYSETYATNGDVTNKTITYSNYTDSTSDRLGNNVPENYFRTISDTYDGEHYLSDVGDNGLNIDNSAQNTEQHGANIDTFDRIQSDIRYYGDNGTPSEVVGLIQVRDCAGNQCGDVMGVRNDEVRLNIGFGGKHEIPTNNPRRN